MPRPLPALPAELALPVFARAAGFTEGGGPSGGAVTAGSAVAAAPNGGRVTAGAVAGGGVASAYGVAALCGAATGAPQPATALSAAAMPAVRASRNVALATSPPFPVPAPTTLQRTPGPWNCTGPEMDPG